jgi:hypothetical protein
MPVPKEDLVGLILKTRIIIELKFPDSNWFHIEFVKQKISKIKNFEFQNFKIKLKVHHESKEPQNIGLYLVIFWLKVFSKFNWKRNCIWAHSGLGFHI